MQAADQAASCSGSCTGEPSCCKGELLLLKWGSGIRAATCSRKWFSLVLRFLVWCRRTFSQCCL